MDMSVKSKFHKVVASSLTLSLLLFTFGGTLASAASDNVSLKLRIMETTDIHTNLMSYDYYKSAVAPTVGLARTATVVKEARKENPNTFLVDNGDLIQGTPLGTYKALVAPIKEGEIHSVYKAMNLMGYDAATFGNHEFNYGLEYLDKAIKGANFPYVNANVYVDDQDNNPENDVNRFEPYQMISKTFKDEAGKEQTLKIGVLGLVTPQITEWDKASLEGKVITKDIVATAEKFVPVMKAKGADLIIVMSHTGFNSSAQANANAEDAVLPLSKVPGIDAITFSHTHKVFPAVDEKALDSLFKDSTGKLFPGVDNAKGTINGVAAVQAGYGGNHLGLIDLSLEKQGGKWTVKSTQSSTRAIYDSVAKTSTVEPDQAIVDAVTADHEATIKYANSPIGTTTAPIHSYFALVQDDPSVQIVTNAQKAYVSDYIKKNLPKYENTPILSVGAPFKAGRNGVEEYTDIAKGPLAIKSAGDLYLYDNTLKAILVKGSVVKEWLEMSAGKFNQIDATSKEEQPLLDASFAVFNFDIIDGVTYQVDVTKPAKYKVDGTVNVATSSRIVNLQYNGKAVSADQEFVVVTNNYRASGGGNFPGVKGSTYIIDSPDENRQILMDYITANKEINPSIDNNWSIAPITADLNVTFTSSPKAEAYAKLTNNITYLNKTDDKGFGIFSIDLSKTSITPTQPTTPGEEPPATPVTPAIQLQFKDVPTTHWAYEYISDLASKKIAAGKTVDTFAPSATVTRSEFASLLVKALNLQATGKAPFKDVPATSWYASAVAAAFENGLIAGTSADTFDPTQNITREQMAVMAKRALELKSSLKSDQPEAIAVEVFKDDREISASAKANIYVLVGLGIMKGHDNGTFAPKGISTRAEAAKVVDLIVRNK